MMLIVAAGSLTGCERRRDDLLAANDSDTGHYEVLSEQGINDATLVVRVRVAELGSAKGVAADIALAKANHSYRAILFEIIGPGDANDASPRQRIAWPADLDYTIR